MRRVWPNRSTGEAHRNVGLALLETGEVGRAIERLGMTLRPDPSDEEGKTVVLGTLLINES